MIMLDFEKKINDAITFFNTVSSVLYENLMKCFFAFLLNTICATENILQNLKPHYFIYLQKISHNWNI